MNKLQFSYTIALVAAGVVYTPIAPGQVSRRLPLITQAVSEDRLATLAGNTRREAVAANDLGRVEDTYRLDHLHIQLKRSADDEKIVEDFIAQLHNPASPVYHRWLTAAQVAERFGLASEDTQAIAIWLKSHGFTVHGIAIGGMAIDFSGNAGQAREAFHTELHRLNVNGRSYVANMSDPRVPAALTPAIAGIVSLNNFRPRPALEPRTSYTLNSTTQLVVPGDLATIYNLKAAFAAGFSGQNQTIAVLEDTNVFTTADWTTFRDTFGLTAAYPMGSFTQVHPSGGTAGPCHNPGANGDDDEAIIDAEWASAAAPNAAIVLASCADTNTNFGGFIALENYLTNGGTPPAVISISYSDPESDLGAASNAYINGLYQMGVLEGVSIFVSSGDTGAAVADYNGAPATHGTNISGFSSTPYNVSVGGTDYYDSALGLNSVYWGTNNATYASAISYIPEIPWNDTCASTILSAYIGFSTTYGPAGLCGEANLIGGSFLLNDIAGSGGPSACASGTSAHYDLVGGSCAPYPKPSWQAGFAGIKSDGVRDIPDVSLFAANGIWGHYYVVCYSDTANGGAACNGAPSNWSGAGGTSFASPIMAAIQALVNQKTGSRQGNPLPTYYALAAAEYGATGNANCKSNLGNAVANTCVFYDITSGDNDVACSIGQNCYRAGTAVGVLSTSSSSYQPTYPAGVGWDFATGIGSVNALNLILNWPVAPH